MAMSGYIPKFVYTTRLCTGMMWVCLFQQFMWGGGGWGGLHHNQLAVVFLFECMSMFDGSFIGCSATSSFYG